MNNELKQLQREIGHRIRFHRTKYNLTQLQLAQIAKLPSASRVSEYERGSYSIGLETLLKIATALKISVCDLVEDKSTHFLEAELESMNESIKNILQQAQKIKKQIDRFNDLKK